MGRRSRPQYTADQVLSLAISSPVFLPGHTVRLERNSLVDYQGRATSPSSDIAELYHENSKLNPSMLPALLETATDSAQLRREYLRRRAALATTTANLRRGDREHAWDAAPADLGHWVDLLAPVAAGDPEAFYAVDLRLVSGSCVYSYEPDPGILSLVARLEPDRLQRLVAAFDLLAAEPAATASPTYVVLVGCFPRNEILLGPRGYRRTLLEAGRLLERVVRQAEARGLHPVARYEFDDAEVDLLLEADGVEQGAVAAIQLD